MAIIIYFNFIVNINVIDSNIDMKLIVYINVINDINVR